MCEAANPPQAKNSLVVRVALLGRLKLIIGRGRGEDASHGSEMFLLRFKAFISVMN